MADSEVVAGARAVEREAMIMIECVKWQTYVQTNNFCFLFSMFEFCMCVFARSAITYVMKLRYS